jgi:hypothetical protein
MDAPTTTKFQRFTSNPPLSSFKKLIVSTPRVLSSLHTMSLAKAVPDGLKDCECERITLCECPLVPYVPKKDIVQETVSALKNDQSLKTSIGEGAELLLEPSPRGTYVMYPYQESYLPTGHLLASFPPKGHLLASPYRESQYYRALVPRLDIRYIWYLITTKAHM